MTDAKKKAVGYVRVSTTAQAQEGESLDTQKNSIAAYCEHTGLELVQTFADEGLSGRNQDRPGLLALLHDAAQRQFDVVIVSRFTRFGRSTLDLLNNLKVLEENAVHFISLKENVDTSTPAGRLMRTVLAGIAEFESEVIKDQLLENRGIMAKRGDILVGKPPFGYRWNKETKEFEVNPPEAAVYKRMVDMYLNEGLSYSDITLRLRSEGIKAKKALFSSTVVGQVLKSPTYLGRAVRNTHKYKGNVKLDEMKPADQHFEITLPPLITKKNWDKLQEKITFNKYKTKRTTNHNFWLRNVLVCGECGGVVKPRNSLSDKRDGWYVCYWANAGKKHLEVERKQKCSLPQIKAEELHAVVEGYLFSFLTFGGFEMNGYAPSRIEENLNLQMYDEQITELAYQLNQFKRAIGRKTTERGNLFSMLGEAVVDRNLFLTQMAQVGEEIRTLEAQIVDTEQKLADLGLAKTNHEEMITFIKGNQPWLRGIADQIQNWTPQEKQQLIESMVDGKIEVVGPPGPSDEEYSGGGGDKSKKWMVNRPSFIFNVNMLDKIELHKNNKYQSGRILFRL